MSPRNLTLAVSLIRASGMAAAADLDRGLALLWAGESTKALEQLIPLGAYYANGKPAALDADKGFAWSRYAHERGSSWGTLNIGAHYDEGIGSQIRD